MNVSVVFSAYSPSHHAVAHVRYSVLIEGIFVTHILVRATPRIKTIGSTPIPHQSKTSIEGMGAMSIMHAGLEGTLLYTAIGILLYS